MAKDVIENSLDSPVQSPFVEVFYSLKQKPKNINGLYLMEKKWKKLQSNGYWHKVPFGFKNVVGYALKYLKSTKKELEEISKETQYEVKKDHCLQLRKSAAIASNINGLLENVWAKEYVNKEPDNKDFQIAESIYVDARDMTAELLSLSAISKELVDFIGETNKRSNFWVSATHMLFDFLLVLNIVMAIFKPVLWIALPVLMVVGFIALGLIGVSQFRKNDLFKEESFASLFIEVYKNLILTESEKVKKMLSASSNKKYYPEMHTCEHILNQTMVRMFGCERSVNAHIEKKKSKCDYLLNEAPTDEQVEEIVSKVNEVIESNLPVYDELMSREEAAKIVDLSKLPEDASDTLRIIRVGDYDACACIGLHVQNTSEIGKFEIVSHNFDNGCWRVRFKLV